jgi:recombinational DNA repair protein RecT
METRNLIKELDLNVSDKRKIAEMERVAASFTGTLQKIHHRSENEAWSIYDRESAYFRKALSENAKLASCTGVSLYSAFLEIAIQGLSIQAGQKSEAYLESRSVKQSDGSYQNTAFLRITTYGELNMRIASGQIIRMNNPQVIYEGDTFQPHTNEKGDLIVDYRPAIPRKSNTIVGCYVCIVLPHDQRDFKWLLQDDIARLRGYSERGMGGKANALYGANGGQVDAGFLEAKTIKHAMRAYTKLKIGDSASFEEENDLYDDPKNVTFGAAEAERGLQEESTVIDTSAEDSDIF